MNETVNRRPLILLLGVVLFAIGAGLIWYGGTLPSDLIVHGIWFYSNHSEANSLMYVGFYLVCISTSFLLFWFFTRSKPSNVPFNEKYTVKF
jgi:hypothetical protein